MSKYSFDSYQKKRISFIMATRNRALFLEKALKNYRNLKGKNDELIIIDGGSIDDTLEVLKRFSKDIEIVVSEKDVSEAHALNKAVLLSRGKYIKTLTDDDIYYSEAIEQAFQVMEQNSDVEILLGGGVKSRGKKTWNAYAPPGSDYGHLVEDVFTFGGCGLGMFIRRSAFAKTGLFTSFALAMDVDYLTKAIHSRANVKFCRIKMFHHPLEDHSASVNRWNRLIEDVGRIKKQYRLTIPLFQRLRKKIASLVFPYLPTFVKLPYINYMKQRQKIRKIKPIWDGGFS